MHNTVANPAPVAKAPVPKALTLAVVATLGLAVLVHFLPSLGLAIPDSALLAVRLLFLLAVVAYGVRKDSLTAWILISMLIGAEFGHDLPGWAKELKVVSKIFLKMIKSIIAPLLFGTLVVGIAGHSNLKQVGRMGLKAIIYFEIVTTIALFIGLAAINLTRAGAGINITGGEDEGITAPPAQGWQDIVLHIFPENLAKSVAEGQVLQIVVFSIIFGIAAAMAPERERGIVLRFTEALSEVMFKFTRIVMYFAPVAVGAAIAYTVSSMGISILQNLFTLLLTLYGALIAFMLLVLLPVALIVRMPIRLFIKAIAEPVSLAFATTSSEAALPKAMKAMEAMGVPRKIVAFVMPTGYSFNLDGTTLYLALASVFVAQAAGIELTLGQQLLMVFTLMLTSKGVAGVPRASLVILLGTAVSFGLPVEPIFIILGIDELMDMARTSVNVIGNCLATYVVGRWEGEIGEPDPALLAEGKVEE